MIDVHKPLLGALQGASSCDLYTSYPQTVDQEEGKVTSVITWPLIDFATLPRSVGQVSSTVKGALLKFDTPIAFNAIYVASQSGEVPLSVSFYYWVVDNPTRQQARSTHTLSYGKTTSTVAGRLMDPVYQNIVALFIPFTFEASKPLDIGELAVMYITEMQHNPVQSSYTITPNQANVQSFTCQNGRKITYYASEPTYDINAEFEWSDEGELAAEIHKINRYRMLSGSPLVYFPASEDLIQRPVYFINVPQSSVVAHSDSKVYSTSISGGTQP